MKKVLSIWLPVIALVIISLLVVFDVPIAVAAGGCYKADDWIDSDKQLDMSWLDTPGFNCEDDVLSASIEIKADVIVEPNGCYGFDWDQGGWSVWEKWTSEEDKGDCKDISNVTICWECCPPPTPTDTLEPTPTDTPEPTPTPTDTPEEPTPTPTDTPEEPTPTPTDTPEKPTQTPTDTPEEPTPTPTDTPEEPTPTPTPTDQPDVTPTLPYTGLVLYEMNVIEPEVVSSFLIIPDIGVSTSVWLAPYTEYMGWDIAGIGEIPTMLEGTHAIAGHLQGLFYDLYLLEPGDQIFLNGIPYIMREERFVSPFDMDVLEEGDLVLFTCSWWTGSTYRYRRVIIADALYQ